MKFIPLTSFQRINSLLQCVQHPLEQGVLLTLHLQAFTCRHTRQQKQIAHHLVAYYNEVLSTPPLGPSCKSHVNEMKKPTLHHNTLTVSPMQQQQTQSHCFSLPLPPLVLGSTSKQQHHNVSVKNNSLQLQHDTSTWRVANDNKNDYDVDDEDNDVNYRDHSRNQNKQHGISKNNYEDKVANERNEQNNNNDHSINASRKAAPFTLSDIDSRLVYFVAALNSVYGDDGYDFSILSEQDFLCYEQSTFKDRVNEQLFNLPEKCLPALRNLWTSIEQQVLDANHGCEYYQFNCPSCDPCNESAITSHHYFLYNKRRKIVVLMRLITAHASQSRRLLQHGNALINTNNSNNNNREQEMYNDNDEYDDDEGIKQRRWLAWKKENVYTMECDDDDEHNVDDAEFSNEYEQLTSATNLKTKH